MIVYNVRYTFKSESDREYVRMPDAITVRREMSEQELERELSWRWAYVRGENNHLYALTIESAREY